MTTRSTWPWGSSSFKILVSLVFAACGGAPTVKSEPPAIADLVFLGGTVRTMDPLRPRAEALAVQGGRILVVGAAADVRRYVGAGTRVVDLRGGTVTPGLVDGHAHLWGLGKALETLSLRGLASPEEAARLVGEAARARSPGEWIEGRGWDQNLWASRAFPTRDLLDAVAPRNPVALRRVDGHALWVNGAALAAAGIDERTPDPTGGRIVRDPQGRPTGVLIDRAIDLVERRIPPDSPEVRRRRILAGAHRALDVGLTGVHEMGIDDATLAVYRDLAARGELPIRVYAFLEGEGQVDSLATRRPDLDPDGTAIFVLRGVKLYADGALGSRGAALLAPYADDPSNRGLVLLDEAALAHAARMAVAHGWQLAIHAIGDRANRMVLDAYEAAGVAGRDLRFRIEHAQVVAPEDVPRFGRLGVAAAMQPIHATSDMPWAEARLGPERVAWAYAWRTLLDAGARLIGGSDFPVEEASPLLGLYAAVTRQDAQGRPEGGWRPEQRLTLDEAIRMFTVEPAWASFQERNRGRIAPGFIADLTVFDRELSADRGLLEARVKMVVIGGRVVREAGAD